MQVPPLQEPTMPAGGRACWRLPLQGALAMVGRPLARGLGRSRLLLTTGLVVGGRPYMGAGRPSSSEIVYPCIPNLDGEDKGGQASSSLAVFTRWISTAKLLQSDPATLAQREGGELEVMAKATAYQP
ncbi:hypothetical protein B296_00030862 [Ensete ventricosum]|uniref:Uncharacterized protein n=1 Tax=Ensete ventricosum TaxID=4639 RepID=A0A426X0Y8_ENSVE|nr:hypothetical protein B296_00030862 [Ensete ventricosum]